MLAGTVGLAVTGYTLLISRRSWRRYCALMALLTAIAWFTARKASRTSKISQRALTHPATCIVFVHTGVP